MARPLRIEYAGAFYHVLNRGLERRDIFRNSRDYENFLSLLEDMRHKYQLVAHAYSLIPNHYHLFLETPQGQLSVIMRHIDGVYTQRYNKKYNRAGPLFQGRYKAILVEKEAYSLELSRYIHLNPLKAGLVRNPEDWLWSSYKNFINRKPPPEFLNPHWLLSQFGTTSETAKKNFIQFTWEGLKQNWDPFKNLKKGSILGEDSFVAWVQQNHIKNKIDPEIPHLKKFKKAPSGEEITAVVRGLIAQESLQQKFLIYALKNFSGLKLKEIGEKLGGIKYSAISTTIKRLEGLAQKDPHIKALLKQLEEKCEM